MNPGSDESSLADNITVQQPEGTSTGSVTSGDLIDQIFDRFKAYIDTKLGAFKNTFPLQDDSPTLSQRNLGERLRPRNSNSKATSNSFCLMHKSKITALPPFIPSKETTPRRARSS